MDLMDRIPNISLDAFMSIFSFDINLARHGNKLKQEAP
jgi:hypothetical protein